MSFPKFKALLVCIDNVTRNHNASLELRDEEESKHLIWPSKFSQKPLVNADIGKKEKGWWLGMLPVI